MSSLDRLNSRVEDVRKRVRDILSRENQIEENENRESEELKIIEDISSSLKKSKDPDILKEEVREFKKALDLIDRISRELEQTGSDLEQIMEEIEQNETEIFEIVGKLAEGEMKIGEADQAKMLAEDINRTHEDSSKIAKEINYLEKEVEKAKLETKKLDEINRRFNDLNEGEKISIAKSRLDKISIDDLKHKMDYLRDQNEQILDEIEEGTGMERRQFIKGSATVALVGITGLSGCMASDAEIPTEFKEKLQAMESQLSKELSNYNSDVGKNVLDPSSFNFRSIGQQRDNLIILVESGINTHSEGSYKDLNSVISGFSNEDVKDDLFPVFGLFIASLVQNFEPRDVAEGDNGLRALNFEVQSHENKSRLEIELGRDDILKILGENPSNVREATELISDKIESVSFPVL